MNKFLTQWKLPLSALAIALIAPMSALAQDTSAQDASQDISVQETQQETQMQNIQDANLSLNQDNQTTQSNISQLEQSISTQSPQAQTTSESQPVDDVQIIDARSALSRVEGGDESSLLAEIAKYQAQLNLVGIISKIEKGMIDLERERMKFEKEKRDAKAEEEASTSNPVMGSNMQGTMPDMQGPMQNSMGNLANLGVEPQEPEADISVRSIYSFDGRSYAELMVDSVKYVAEKGTKLPTGETVVSITPTSVSINRKGKTQRLPMFTGSSSLSGSSAGSATPSTAPRSLPPIPSN